MTRNLAADVTKEIAKNLLMALPPVRAWRLRRARTMQALRGDEDFLGRYAFQATRHLLAELKSVTGLHIAEIGPGDYLTSGLALLAAGAHSYTAIDRFPGPYGSDEAKKWYGAIETAWPAAFPAMPWPSYLEARRFPDAYPDRVQTISRSIESVESARSFDVVCSYQVAEHVSDIRAFAETTARLLSPGGIATHRVDFGPHDCWIQYRDPLTFLRFPDWLWSLMGSNRGTPNRHRHHEFLEAFAAAGLTCETTSLEYFAVDEVDLGRLAARYRSMERESILVKTAVYRCRIRRPPPD